MKLTARHKDTVHDETEVAAKAYLFHIRRAAKDLERGFPNIALGAIADGLARMRDTQGELMTYPEKLLRTIQDLHSVLHHMEKWQRARLAEAEHPEAIRRVQ